MSDLAPVTLTYNGKPYEVSEQDSIWGLIESIEDVISFFELAQAVGSNRFPTARIFRAFAAAISYAGCKVTANDVRQACDGYQSMGEMAGALLKILMLAQPPMDSELRDLEATGPVDEGKKKAG